MIIQKIIVVQREREDLKGIMDAVKVKNQHLANEIIYTTEPDKALESVICTWKLGISEWCPIFIFSGQIFSEGSIRRGTELAKVVKERYKNSFFFIYSSMPEPDACIDGFIYKQSGVVPKKHDSIAEKICRLWEHFSRKTIIGKVVRAE